MIGTTRNFIFTVASTIFLIACSGFEANLPAMPDIGIPSETFNQHFQIAAPDELNSLTFDEGVELVIEVTGQNLIAFDFQNGVRLFTLKDDSWMEIPNFVEYPAGYIVLEPAKGDPFKTGGTFVSPVYSGNEKKVTLRIIIIGNIVSGGQITDDRVAGYIDVQMEP